MPTPYQFTLPLGDAQVLVTRRRSTGVVTRTYPDGRITLSVPRWFTRAQAVEFLESNRARILAQLASCEPSPRERAYRRAIERLAAGDVVPVWGGECTVVHEATAGRARIELGGDGDGLIRFALPPEGASDTEEARAVRRRLFERLLRRELADRLPGLRARCEQVLGVTTATWTIRRMRSRWGSCRCESGTISINLDLATHDPAHLENVALHETCHRLVPNHGPRFQALMDRVSPRWRELDRALAAEGVRLA